MYVNWDLLALPEMDFQCRVCIKFQYFVCKKTDLYRYTTTENMILNILFIN